MWDLTLPLAVAGAIASMSSVHERVEGRWSDLIRWLMLSFIASPFLALMYLFLINDLSYHYVWTNGGADLPLRYRVAALWAAREGPLLMWVAWLAIVAGTTHRLGPEESSEFRRTRLGILHIASLLLLLIVWGMDPFRRTADPTIPSAGLNNLLQTDLMVVHPPLMFLGYALCLAVAAPAIAGMVHGADGPAQRERLLRSANPALIVMTVAIGLGGLWAYLVLDWGGYWAWDPVETGSLLPWLALVVLVHLRSRPGRLDPALWSGAALLPAGLAIMATLVTRASGVWANSVHTFVTASDAAAPSTVWGRVLALREDAMAGVEVMAYVQALVLLGVLWALSLVDARPWSSVKRGLAACTVLIAPVISLLSPDPALWAQVPGFLVWMLPLSVAIPSMTALAREGGIEVDRVGALQVLGVMVIHSFTADPWLTGTALLLGLPLLRPSNTSGRPWLIALVTLELTSSWAGALTTLGAGLSMAVWLAPWLLLADVTSDRTDSSQRNPWRIRAHQTRMLMTLPPALVGVHLILTYALLIGGIDRTQLEAHELFGAPLVAAVGVAMAGYAWRRDLEPHVVARLSMGLVILSLMLAILGGSMLPADAWMPFSGPLTRGQVAWVMLPALAVAIPSMVREVAHAAGAARTRQDRRAIRTLGAHVIHVGLLVLLLGHVMSTTLVDRGDLEHRLTLIRDEPIVHGDLVYIFEDLVVIDESSIRDHSDVGDAYLGAVIHVRTLDGTTVGTVEPGMLRFDATGSARSEVDRLPQWSGDLIVIFDGTQARGLMQTMSAGTLDDVDRIRVTIYDLPASHAVWLGWSIMLIGMGTLLVQRRFDEESSIALK